MKALFINPEMEIKRFAVENIVTASEPTPAGGNNIGTKTDSVTSSNADTILRFSDLTWE